MLMTFGEAMLRMIKNRGLSATAVAEELGFRSRTAFFRILHDECRLPSIEKCFEAAVNSRLLALTAEEIEQLRVSMRISEIGRHAYAINKVLANMVHPEEESDQPLDSLAVEGVDGVSTVEDILLQLCDQKEVRIVLLGCCRKALLDRLHRFTQEADVAEILHFFAIDDEDPKDMEVFSQISSILFSSVYEARFINETGKSEKDWGFRSGVMIFFVNQPNGESATIQLTPLSKDHYFGQCDSGGSLERFWTRMIRNAWEKSEALKQEDSGEDAVPDVQKYIEFTDEFRRLEYNRAIYMIKPDFPINCVPVEMIAPLIAVGFMEFTPDIDPQMIARFKRLYEIHESRVENLYEKKKPTHIILNQEAMMRFAITGQRSDHFFLGRPYTRDERIQLLTLLRDQTRDNPNFNIWFSRSTSIVDDKEVTVYENYGVSLIKADTSWHLERDHQEIMLKSRMLAENFKQYFVKGMLADEVMSEEKSIALLEQMIEMAKNA